jgi:outer membrane protein
MYQAMVKKWQLCQWVLLCTFLLISMLSNAQQPLSLQEIPARVEANLPGLNALQANSAAAAELISYEKRSLVPDLTVGYQANMATFNNITGMSYPGLFMPISGPPSLTNTFEFTPGSAATALLTWQPFTFGQRTAAIRRAAAGHNLAEASYREQRLKYTYLAMAAYLEAVYYRQITESHKATISRFETSLAQALVLAQTGLKPGIDTLQLQNAIEGAEIELLQSEKLSRQKLIHLQTLLGNTSTERDIVLSDTSFYKQEIRLDTAVNLQTHPSFQAAQAQVNVRAAEVNEAGKAWRPSLDLWGNAYGRGSGINVEGEVNDREGLRLTRQNIGIGAQLSIPLLGFYQNNSKKKYYRELLKADEYKSRQVELELEGQVQVAMEEYSYNQLVSARTASRLTSARLAYESLQVSYQSGLVDFVRLTLAQYELQQAEIHDTAARLMLWRSLLDISMAKGDLNIFFQQVKQ